MVLVYINEFGYTHNVNRINDDLIQDYEIYLTLGNNFKEQCLNHQSIFEQTIPRETIGMTKRQNQIEVRY